MPTNDERRDVAAGLRELVADCFDDGEFYDRCEVEDVLGLATDDGAWYEAAGVRRLADLIEPEERTCRNIADKNDREFGAPFICSECGADPHDAESYFCGFSNGEHDWRFCPNCGAKVVEE